MGFLDPPVLSKIQADTLYATKSELNSYMTTVTHDGNVSAVRPLSTVVHWIGWVKPNAMQVGDLWFEIAEPSFSPLADIAWDIAYYADAITGVADGATFSTWPDSSGHSRDATRTANAGTNFPTFRSAATELNGQSAVEFALSPMRSPVLPTNLAQPHTLVAVGRVSNTSTTGTYMCADDSATGTTPSGPYRATDGNWRVNAGASLVGPASDADVHIFIVTFNGSSTTMRINGATTTGNAGTVARTSLQLGGKNTASGGVILERMNGHIAFAATIGRVLTTDEISELHAWAATKYGLTIA